MNQHHLNVANQKPGLLPLNQVSEIYELIYKAEAGEISPIEGKKCLRKILSEKHQFGPLGILVGYILIFNGYWNVTPTHTRTVNCFRSSWCYCWNFTDFKPWKN